MSSPVPLELQSKIQAWRRKAAEGTLELSEMKEAIKWLQQGRQSASATATTAKKKAAAVAVPSAESMLGDLEAL